MRSNAQPRNVITNQPYSRSVGDIEVVIDNAPLGLAIRDYCRNGGMDCVVIGAPVYQTIDFHCTGSSARCWRLFRRSLTAYGAVVNTGVDGVVILFPAPGPGFRPPPPAASSAPIQ